MSLSWSLAPGLKRERLLYKAYLEQKSGIKDNDTNWLTRIKDILNQTGFSFVFDIKETNDTNKTPNIDTKLAYEIQQRFKEIFEQQTLYHLEEKEIKSEGKLVFYSKIKRKYKKELYLQSQNIKNRNVIRNLRISTHKVNIETGRYKGINRDERICELCILNTVETEIHFLTECPTFNDERISFLNDLNTNHNVHIYIYIYIYIYMERDEIVKKVKVEKSRQSMTRMRAGWRR